MPKMMVVALCLFLLPSSSRDVLAEELNESLRNRVEAGRLHGSINVRDRAMHVQMGLSQFYEQRTYKPAWVDGKGPMPQAHTLVRLIKEAAAHGLRPTDYHLDAIETLLERTGTPSGNSLTQTELVDLDLLSSDAFLLYAAHLEAGRVNPETIRASFHARRASRNLAAMLQESLESGRLEVALKSLGPPFAEYTQLKAALARYRQIAAEGGWPILAVPRKMKKGDRDKGVIVLRKRLRITEDLPASAPADENLFDDGLEQGVRTFQKRHGIDADGVVGPATLAALNVPAERRVRQIELNLERWRWLPEDLGERYILVNTAAFSLHVVENGELMMNMRVVVGKPYRHTPVFSGNMTYLVLNPYWHVPPSIAVKDKLPLIRKDPEYLKRENNRRTREPDWSDGPLSYG